LVDELRATDAVELVQVARREAALADFDLAVKGIEYTHAHRRAVLAHLEVAVVEARTRLLTAAS
jgi:hypothetical protein